VRKAHTESFKKKAMNSLADVVYSAALAVHDDDGHIKLEFSDGSEDQIDLDAFRPQPQTIDQEEEKILQHQINQCPPKMNICIMIVGTRGDVQPFIGIAKLLQSHGHRVRLATHAVYREFVMENGIEYYPLGGNPKELSAYMVKTGGHLIPLKLEHIRNDIPRNMKMIEEILHSTWPAVSAADPDARGKGKPGDPFAANAIISNPVTYGHIHVAEKLGIPLHIMFPQPWVPTTAFPHPLSNMPYDGKAKKKNYLSYKLVDLLMWQGTESMVNEFRTEKLGLRKIRKGDGGRDMLLDLRIPHAFMWSPHLVPKPADWGSIYDVIGTVTLKGTASTYNPTPELEAFLGNDEGPIFVGFGSMVIADPVKMTSMIIKAAERAGTRVLIQSSWTNMAGDMEVPKHVFFLGNCPHDWLMPRVRAVVHHGGAGTTAAGLMAGKPTFIVPFFGDQPFWGRAVLDIGVGVEPCPIHSLTEDILFDRFQKLISPQIAKNAQELGQVMVNEDGVSEAIKVFYRNLPIEEMRCDLHSDRIATQWSRHDRMKLCEECAYVISNRDENVHNEMIEYHAVNYSARGPDSGLEGASSGAGAFLHEIGSGFKDIFVQPAKGYRQEGARGAVVGLAKGLGGLIIRPVQGAALLADHIATGHYNKHRAEGQRKKSTVLNTRLLNKTSTEHDEIHTADMNDDDFDTNSDLNHGTSKKELRVFVSKFDREKIQLNFQQQIREKTSSDDDALSVAFEKEKKNMEITRSLSPVVPSMNICLFATGAWDANVTQIVAVALKLKAERHRVRVATHEVYRTRIIQEAGLEFYPLGGKPSTLSSYLGFLHQKKNKKKLFGRSSNNVFPRKQELKELVFSLWNAAIDADPLYPKQVFRADLIIGDPLMMGQTAVVERLGIPFHIISTLPVASTNCFPSILDPSNTHFLPYKNSSMNSLNHSVVYTKIREGMEDILDEFRAFLGLTGRTFVDNLLYLWKIPHTFLWDARLLPKPTDWGSEMSIAGFIQQEKNLVIKDSIHTMETTNTSELDEFIMTTNEATVVVFSLTKNPCESSDVVVKNESHPKLPIESLEKFAKENKLRIVVHTDADVADDTNSGRVFSLTRNEYVFEIYGILPLQSLLSSGKIKAVIHSSDISFTGTCLLNGVPVAYITRISEQHLWTQSLIQAGLGVGFLEPDKLSFDTISHLFKTLLDASLQEKVKEFAKSVDRETVLQQIVDSIYANLPWQALLCDLDETKLARVYDDFNKLKLSYEAQLVIQPICRHDNSKDLHYKPILYSLKKKPRFSLTKLEQKVNKGDTCTLSKVEEEETKPTTTASSTTSSSSSFTSSVVHSQEYLQPVRIPKNGSSLARTVSKKFNVVALPSFWKSHQEEKEKKKQINALYEQFLIERTTKYHTK
jgi:sterol 3beta-glucosyltransferase